MLIRVYVVLIVYKFFVISSELNETLEICNSTVTDNFSLSKLFPSNKLKIISFRKCCDLGLNYDQHFGYCAANNETFVFSRYFSESELVNTSCLHVSYGPPVCSEDEALITVIIKDEYPTIMTSSGLKILNYKFVHTDKYCIDESVNNADETVARLCLPADKVCNKFLPCFRKCCKKFDTIYTGPGKCGPSNQPFQQKVYNLSDVNVNGDFTQHEFSLVNYGVIPGEACGFKKKYLLHPEKNMEDLNYFNLDGSLYLPNLKAAEQYMRLDRDHYCLEYVTAKINKFVLDGVYAFKCFVPKAEKSTSYIIIGVGLVISCVFLLATFIVYLALPKLQNLYGKTLMGYVFCLFICCLCLAVVDFFSRQSIGLRSEICTSIGYAILFSTLSAYTWLNVMSIDIWKTFRAVRSTDSSRFERDKRRYLLYSLYAWGVPIALTSACAVMDFSPGLGLGVFKPDIGKNRCWFFDKSVAVYIFYITPTSIIIVCNTVLFGITSWKCSKVKAEISKMQNTGNEKKFSANKAKLAMNIKLFVVMGLTWSLDIVSFVVRKPPWLFYIPDILNALNGLIIFCIFVLKKNILLEVGSRLGFHLKQNSKKDTKTENSKVDRRYQGYRNRKSSSSSTFYTNITSTGNRSTMSTNVESQPKPE